MMRFVGSAAAIALSAFLAQAEEEALLLYRRGDLEAAREKLEAGDAVVKAAYEDVLADSRKWLRVERLSVVDKTLLPGSGDRHDYLSIAPYWWPDARSDDGLPYIRKDGKANPESEDVEASDKERLIDFTGAVQTLALAWYFSGEETFAAKAAEMLRAWFFDEETRMNPHLEYAQLRRGHKGGRSGVIEGRAFFRVLDASLLLADSSAWSEEDEERLKAWFGEFLEWMVRSEMGRWEGESANNHGTWYDAQVMAFALFAGKEEAAAEALKRWRGRWATQIEEDGAQPLELERTLSLDYSVFNLVAHFYAGRVAERCGADPWAGKEHPLRSAVEYLAPALYGEREWKRKQIEPLKTEPLLEMIRYVERVFPEAIDEGRVVALAPKAEKDREAIAESRFQLLLPRLDARP